jgi:hypothetical protein
MLVKSINHFDYSKGSLRVPNESKNDQKNKQISLNSQTINNTQGNESIGSIKRGKVRPMTCNVVKTRRFQTASNLSDVRSRTWIGSLIRLTLTN